MILFDRSLYAQSRHDTKGESAWCRTCRGTDSESLFMIGFGWEIEGAALTTVVIQIISFLILLPCLFGLDGVLYAGSIAEILAFILAMSTMYRHWQELIHMEQDVPT